MTWDLYFYFFLPSQITQTLCLLFSSLLIQALMCLEFFNFACHRSFSSSEMLLFEIIMFLFFEMDDTCNRKSLHSSLNSNPFIKWKPQTISHLDAMKLKSQYNSSLIECSNHIWHLSTCINHEIICLEKVGKSLFLIDYFFP